MEIKSFTKIIFILFLFNYSRVYPQQIDVVIGDSINLSSNEFNFINNDSTNVYVFRIKDNSLLNKYNLEIYNRATLKRTAIIPIPFSNSDSVKFHIENLAIQKDNYYLFYSYFDKKSKGEKLEVINFNNKGEKNEEPFLLDFSDGRNEKKAGWYNVIIPKETQNEFKVSSGKLINDTNVITFSNFDFNFNRFKTQKFKLEESFGNLMLIKTDPLENVYYLSSTGQNSNGRLLKMRIFSPESDTAFNLIFSKPSKYNIYLSPKIHAFYSANKIFNIITTYSASESSNITFGVYWIQIDPISHACIKEKFVKFKEASAFNTDDKDINMESCIISDIIYSPEKGYIINFESRTRYKNSVYGITTSSNITFGDVRSMWVDTSLKPNSLLKIHKKQVVNDDEIKYCGYLFLESGSKMYFINNNLEQNLNVSPDKISPLNSDQLEKSKIIISESNDSKILSMKLAKNENGDKIEGCLLPGIKSNLSTKESISVYKNTKTNSFHLIKFIID